jgi:hypothetical protein
LYFSKPICYNYLMTRNSFRKLSFILTAVVLFSTLYLSTTYATLAPLTPPPLGGYDAGANSILDPGCTPTDTDCFVKEFEGWKLTGNTGTTAGTNFIGTTDAQDFMIKTNGNQIALFGQNGGVSFGSDVPGFGLVASIASGGNSFATGVNSVASGALSAVFGYGTTASGLISVAFGGASTASGDFSTVFGNASTASGNYSTAFGNQSTASGATSVAFGVLTSASGNYSTAFGNQSTASGDYSTAFGNTSVASGDTSTAFGSGSVASGSASTVFGMQSTASGDYSTASGQASIASGLASTALGNQPTASGFASTALGNQPTASGFASTALGNQPTASGDYSTAFGNTSIASGSNSTAFGNQSTASGDYSTVFGYGTTASSFGEIAMGAYNTTYTPIDSTNWAPVDRLMSIGNSEDQVSSHNAYTLWKDGSFAYNDDNFQNDDPGTEQNMFYFNYGNHDGSGSAQTKRAIRLGSAINNEWDIDTLNVGDRSIALGFNNHSGLIASGLGSIVIGAGGDAVASGAGSIAIGSSVTSTADASLAMGLGTTALGRISTALGNGSIAFSLAETAIGMKNTIYIPVDNSNFNLIDRLFVIGNGNGISSDPNEFSDTLTILKNGKTGIGIDNFETTASSALLQVGDSSWTGDMARFQNSAGNCTITNPTGWTCSSDERLKTNINTLSNYGLGSVLALRPVTFNWTHGENPTSTIGFIAQEVQAVIPNIVTTDHESGFLSLNTTQMTPIIVKAIQEMNLNITDINNTAVANTWRDALISWFGNVGNGIQRIFTKTIRVQNGVEMIDHATGEIYCTFIENGEFKKVAGECTDTIITTNSPTVPIVSPDPIIDTASDPTTDPVVDPATDPIVTSPEIPTDTPVVSDPVSSDPAPEPVTTTE